MQLYKAMRSVILKSKTPLKAGLIADIINTFRIYTQNCGIDVTNKQIVLEAEKFENIFETSGDVISLR